MKKFSSLILQSFAFGQFVLKGTYYVQVVVYITFLALHVSFFLYSYRFCTMVYRAVVRKYQAAVRHSCYQHIALIN